MSTRPVDRRRFLRGTAVLATAGSAAAIPAVAAEAASADAELIALGIQFEAALAALIPLDAERHRTFAAYEAEAAAHGLSEALPIDWVAHKAVMDRTGYSRAAEVANGQCDTAIALMEAIYRHHPATLAGFAVFAAAALFEGSEYECVSEPNDMSDNALRRLVRELQIAAAGGLRS